MPMILFAAVLLAGQAGMLALAPALAERSAIGWPSVLGFMTLAMLGGAAWLWACRDLLMRMPWPAWLALGAVMRLIWIDAPVVLNTDHFRYLWEGALTAHGIWPWGAPPAAGVPPALGEPGQALHGQLNFTALRSIYPGTAQAAFALAHALAPWEMLGLRLVALAADACTLWLSLLWLRRAGLPSARAAIWWCCPLVPVLLIGNAHIDVLVPPLLLGALLATLAGRGILAGALLGLAAGVKLWPVLLAPLLGRALPPAQRLGAAMGLALLGGAMLAPLAATLFSADAGLSAYAGRWLINNAPLTWATSLWPGSPAWMRPGVAITAGLVALAVAWRTQPGPIPLLTGMMIVAAVTFYLSPAQYPWYGVWFLPLAALLALRPLLLAAVLLPLYWLWFPMDRDGQAAAFQHGVAALHALPVAAALLIWRRR